MRDRAATSPRSSSSEQSRSGKYFRLARVTALGLSCLANACSSGASAGDDGAANGANTPSGAGGSDATAGAGGKGSAGANTTTGGSPQGGAPGSAGTTSSAAGDAGATSVGGSGGAAGSTSSGGSSSGGATGSAGAGGSAGSAGATNGPWQGIQVSGTGFVDANGKEFIPRGFGIGEWHNIEAYMIGINNDPDTGGVGETKLRTLLAAAMGQAGADQFFATWEANVVTADDVATWVGWGANTVRLPINYHAISSADGSYTEAGFQVIDDFIAWCKAKNIYVILDLHAAPGAQNCEEMSDSPDGVARLWKSPADYRQWTIDLWQTIAKRYANEPAVMGYDIFDEPYDTEDDASFSSGIATLKKMYTDLTTAIRAVDPHHVLFFEGTDWSQCDGFSGLTPAWDAQMAYSFHKYWDDNDTASIQACLDLRTKAQRPIWNGETGENTYKWNTRMIALLEGQKIGWNMWTYKKIVDTGAYSSPDQNETGDTSPAEPTQPYGIKKPANFSVMTDYLGGGKKPTQDQANTIMLAFAANAATSQCTYNADFVKSVFNK